MADYRKYFVLILAFIFISLMPVFALAEDEEEIIRVTAIELDKSQVTLVLGEETELEAAVYPWNADNRWVTWSSSDPLVAEVESDWHTARVISRSQGEAVISAVTADRGLTAETVITVIVLPRTVGIEPQELTLAAGETTEINAWIIPRDATEQGISWESSRPGVASVNQEGEVEALREGETRIIARSVENNELNAYCILTVSAEPLPVADTEDPVNGEAGVEPEIVPAVEPGPDTNYLSYILGGIAFLLMLAVLILLLLRNRRKQQAPQQAVPQYAPGTRPVLVGRTGTFAGQRFYLDAGQLVVGRDHSAAQVVYPPDNTEISRRHCTIYYDYQQRQFILEDTSSNGTFLADGTKLSQGQQHYLHMGEYFSLSETEDESFTVELE